MGFSSTSDVEGGWGEDRDYTGGSDFYGGSENESSRDWASKFSGITPEETASAFQQSVSGYLDNVSNGMPATTAFSDVSLNRGGPESYAGNPVEKSAESYMSSARPGLFSRVAKGTPGAVARTLTQFLGGNIGGALLPGYGGLAGFYGAGKAYDWIAKRAEDMPARSDLEFEERLNDNLGTPRKYERMDYSDLSRKQSDGRTGLLPELSAPPEISTPVAEQVLSPQAMFGQQPVDYTKGFMSLANRGTGGGMRRLFT